MAGEMNSVVETGYGIVIFRRPRPSPCSRAAASIVPPQCNELRDRSFRHLSSRSAPLTPFSLQQASILHAFFLPACLPAVYFFPVSGCFFRCSEAATLAARLPRGRRRQGQRSLPKQQDRDDSRCSASQGCLLVLWRRRRRLSYLFVICCGGGRRTETSAWRRRRLWRDTWRGF